MVNNVNFWPRRSSRFLGQADILAGSLGYFLSGPNVTQLAGTATVVSRPQGVEIERVE